MEAVKKYALPLALLADVVLIIVFAAIGRRTHEEANAVVGVLSTAWPFLVGAAVGWLIVLAAKRSPLMPYPAGVVIWVATVALGMVLRKATDEGTAVSFIIVASCFNLATLVGWRLLARIPVRRKA